MAFGLIATLLIVVLSSVNHSALAVTDLTLVQQGQQEVGPQSASNPCIIAATTCQQPAGFPYNNFTASGSISSYNESQTYTVATLRQFVGDLFWIAIDVNTTSAASERLTEFTVKVNGTTQFQYLTDTVIGGVSNNGNGYADWTLRVVNLSSFNPEDTVVFNAQWDRAVDGGESFFLIPVACTGEQCVPRVPEPSALILLGAGLVFVPMVVRRFSRSKR
ncbi:MAG TPA: PEP-CTERM sorting domain-containing protein [Candidatus Binatia bacterium]|nr:PEP-CTERM sorting domain-containing protein [Candidatus Binatia bacterium]